MMFLASFLAKGVFIFPALWVWGKHWGILVFFKFSSKDYFCMHSGVKLPAGWFGDMYIDTVTTRTLELKR